MMELNVSEKNFLIQLCQDQAFFTKIRRRELSPSIFQDKSYRVIYRHLMQMSFSEVSLDLLSDSMRRDYSQSSIGLKLATARAAEIFSADPVESPYSVDLVMEYAQMIQLRETVADVVESITDGDTERAFELMQKAASLRDSANDSYDLFHYNTLEEWNNRERDRHDRIVNPERVLRWEKLHWNKQYMPFGQPSNTIIAFAAQTGVGKSMHIGNYVWEAASPPNSLNTLLVIAENRYIESGSRLDSIILDMEYDELREVSTNNQGGERFFSSQDGWGRIFVVKCVPTRFSAATIADMIEEIKDVYGVEVEALAIDSPDHMTTIGQFKGESWQYLERIYWEIKAVVDVYDLICATTAQLNRAAGGKDGKGKRKSFSAEDIGKSYGLAQILDGMFVMYRNAADRLKNIVRGVWVKGRDFKLDGRTIEMVLTPSLRFELYKELGIEDSDLDPDLVKRPSFKGIKYRLGQRNRKLDEQRKMEAAPAGPEDGV